MSLEVVLEVPGHFLSHSQTLELMESEYLYPKVADRASIEDWEQEGSPDIRQRALKQVREILSSHYPKYIDSPIDAKLREIFPIRLIEENMRPGNGRWNDPA